MNKEEKPPIISDKTQITLGLLIIVIGSASWITNIAALAQTTSEQVIELKSFIYTELRAIRQDLKEIRDRLPAK